MEFMIHSVCDQICCWTTFRRTFSHAFGERVKARFVRFTALAPGYNSGAALSEFVPVYDLALARHYDDDGGEEED